MQWEIECSMKKLMIVKLLLVAGLQFVFWVGFSEFMHRWLLLSEECLKLISASEIRRHHGCHAVAGVYLILEASSISFCWLSSFYLFSVEVEEVVSSASLNFIWVLLKYLWPIKLWRFSDPRYEINMMFAV